MKRTVTLRLTHTESKWIESALAHRRTQCEQDISELQASGETAYIELIKLQADNLAALEAHVNKAAHRAATH